jgi:malate dehydrogenase (oxaloacetate-decarboxylating)(NADP+)
MLVALGMKMENIWVTDIKGVVYSGRKEEMDDNKARYARKTDARKLAEVIEGADVFLGPVRGRRAQAGDGRRRWRPSR